MEFLHGLKSTRPPHPEGAGDRAMCALPRGLSGQSYDRPGHAQDLLVALVAVRSTRTVLSSSLAPTLALTSMVAPWSSSGTTTGLVKRTPYSTTAPGSPVQSVTTRIASAMVNMPCAMTSGRPTSLANLSFQWIGLKSPEAPAYWTRVARVTPKVCAGSSVPTSTSS